MLLFTTISWDWQTPLALICVGAALALTVHRCWATLCGPAGRKCHGCAGGVETGVRRRQLVSIELENTEREFPS